MHTKALEIGSMQNEIPPSRPIVYLISHIRLAATIVHLTSQRTHISTSGEYNLSDHRNHTTHCYP